MGAIEMIIKRDQQFFLSVAQQGTKHSFMMLGFIKEDGTPGLLARVGKTNDIERPRNTNIFVQVFGKANIARIRDEGIFRKKEQPTSITYKAYAINFEQLKEFLALIAELERKQLENPIIKKAIDENPKLKDPKITKEERDFIESDRRIMCYVPTIERSDGTINFEYKKLEACSFVPSDKRDPVSREKLATQAQQIHVRNTCRTSALDIVESVLGFQTDISKEFFVAPPYKTTLHFGIPEKSTFYILPAPPNVNEHLSPRQLRVLQRLYKKLEDLPKLKPDDERTRNKFNALNKIYKEIAGENQLSAAQLLEKIIQNEQTNKNALFSLRSPSFFSRLFSIQSSTEKTFSKIKKELEKDNPTDDSKLIKK